MKKLFLIAIILFGITGCYDYQELDNRAIIVGIAIDYEEEKFIVNYEILDSKKSGKDSEEIKGYLVEGTGESIVDAIHDASDKLAKESYFSHVKVIIISEEMAQEKLLDVVDYTLRDPNIRSIFIPTVAKDYSAKEILGSTSSEAPVASENIEKLIENNKYNENVSIKVDFDKFMDKFEDKRIEPVVNALTLNNDKIELAGMAIFEDTSLKSILDKKTAAIYNVLTNESSNHSLTIDCENGKTIINLYKNKKTDFEITEDTLKIKSNLKATVVKDSCGNNFRDQTIYEEFNQKYEEVLKKEYEEFWKTIQKEETDILGIQKKYYQKTKKELEKWQDLKLETDITIEINKNGTTFEVKNHE